MGKGASNQQQAISNSQQDFMKTLQQDFGKSFSGQQNIINSLTKSLTDTLNAGPSQFGFSTPETTALNTLATTQNAQAYRQAAQVAGERAAASGVSNAQLPTGAAQKPQAELALQAGENKSNQLLGIQEAGYRQGAENYKEAVSGLTSAASLENPSGLASTANSAGNSAFGSATEINKENQAASPWSQVGGLVGSLAGAALNAYLPGAGAKTKGLDSGIFGRLMKSGAVPTASLDTSNLSPTPIPVQ